MRKISNLTLPVFIWAFGTWGDGKVFPGIVSLLDLLVPSNRQLLFFPHMCIMEKIINSQLCSKTNSELVHTLLDFTLYFLHKSVETNPCLKG